MSDSDAATLIKSIISSDDDISNQAIDRLGGQRTQQLLVCALSVAVQRRFPEGTPSQAISDFATNIRSRYPQAAEQVKPAVVEALVRTVLGEPGLLDDISNDDLVPLEFLVVHDIMSAENLDGTGMDEYVNETVALADAN